MSRNSSLRFVPSVESFEDRFNLSTVSTNLLYQDIRIPTATSSSDYSAIVFVGGWGSSMYQNSTPPNSNETITIDMNRTEIMNPLLAVQKVR